MAANTTALADVIALPICYGVKSGLVDAFVIEPDVAAALSTCVRDAAEIIRPYLVGRDMRRYRVAPVTRHLIYTYHGVDMAGRDAILEHLKEYRKRLEKRATKQEWYELQQPQKSYVDLMEAEKIVFPDIAPHCRFCIDKSSAVCGDTAFAIPERRSWLLGLLNSRAANFWFQTTCAALEGSESRYLRFKLQYTARFPVPAADDAMRNGMVELVQSMLDMNERLHGEAGARLIPQERRVLEGRIASTDREIDRLVYDLYGLTDEEIAIVEAATTT